MKDIVLKGLKGLLVMNSIILKGLKKWVAMIKTLSENNNLFYSPDHNKWD